ncbi:hypothetical protein PAL_GLEAN10001291 [Pteropus alecto]|uniref:Uncharacterized protein n=1 Tax=Pteropus alecto TaxID=9402 RepID=L5KQ53_PTEAL|nr:hypothetical protein PAL_GLEAN10001291 [Pteropus alecto]
MRLLVSGWWLCSILALLLAQDCGRNRERPMLVRSPVPWRRGDGGRSELEAGKGLLRREPATLERCRTARGSGDTARWLPRAPAQGAPQSPGRRREPGLDSGSPGP